MTQGRSSRASRKRLLAGVAVATMAVVTHLPATGQIANASAPYASGEADAASIEQCLVRSAIVPVDESQAGEDAPPTIRVEYAYRTLQYELLLQLPDDLASVAVLRGTHGTIDGLSIVRVDGAPPIFELASPIIDRPEQSQRQLVRVEALADAGSSPVSSRELCAAMSAVIRGVDATSTTTYVAIDPQVARLVVGREGPVEPYIIEIADSLGDRVQYIDDIRLEPAHRSNDINGFSGGIGIMVGGIPRSAGFAARTSGGARYLISAGHCPNNDGNGAAVTNGTSNSWCPGAYAYTPMGSVTSNLLISQHLDVMAIMNSSSTGSMWVGSSCIGSGERSVAFATSSSAGSNVGFSGVRSGQQTGVVTSSPAGCYFFPFEACAVYQATSSAEARLCTPGDSGGPAFGYYTSWSVAAAGIISAHGGEEINRCSYTDIATVLRIYAGTLMTEKAGG